MRTIQSEIRKLHAHDQRRVDGRGEGPAAPYELVVEVAAKRKLPVVNFAAGGIATPADAALMMQLGRGGRLRGLGHLQVRRPARRAAAIVRATTHYADPDMVAKVSRGLGGAMVASFVEGMPQPHRLAERGW